MIGPAISIVALVACIVFTLRSMTYRRRYIRAVHQRLASVQRVAAADRRLLASDQALIDAQAQTIASLEHARQAMYDALVDDRRGRMWALRTLAQTASLASTGTYEDADTVESLSSVAGEALSMTLTLEQQNADLGIVIPTDEEETT